MLAQKLMGSKDFNIDDEVMSLEKLKQRFGEQTLQACNIIVKDYKDSKKIDNFINK
jgi:anaphase-promoting complex subunit 2